MTPLAVHITVVLGVAAVVLAVVVLALIVFAPWKSVRDEPPLDDEFETRLLLGEDPARVAADADAADARRSGLHEVGRDTGDLVGGDAGDLVGGDTGDLVGGGADDA